MGRKIHIGNWIESEPRKVQGGTYYAADWIEHELRPGRYPLYLTFEGGYLMPMPYWLLATVDSRILDGRLYSGFGGLNFASTKVEPKDSTYHFQLYSYQLPDLIDRGGAEVFPEWEPFLQAIRADKDWIQSEHGNDLCHKLRWVEENITWEKLAEMEKEEQACSTRS